MNTDVDCVVLGAGVVGLAIARELAMNGREVLVIDQAEDIGTGTSSRNSEVIHAGLYYKPGSLKARSCVQGKDMLYAYCAERGIAHQRTGKLIVAANETEAQQLEVIAQRAAQCGVTDLTYLDKAQARALEPELVCHSALLSPSTGIIDSHALMLTLQGDAENHGAHCVFHTPFHRGRFVTDGVFELEFSGDEPQTLTARTVINATGLHAPDVARQFANTPQHDIPAARYCKGNYFTLSGRSPFNHLIYPVPNDSGLGIHLTLDLGGQAKFGPDTQWIGHIDYSLDDTRAKSFYSTIRRYWPALPDYALQPGYTGIRPKITDPGVAAADFLIQGPANHGIDGLIHLMGIESPGLTACLALAQHVDALLHPHRQTS